MAATDTVSIVSQVNFRLKVQNISQLKEVRSPKFIIQGIAWRMRAIKTIEGSEQLLAIYLHCESKDKSPEWTQPAAASFKLLPFNGNSSAKEYHLEPHIFDRIENASGCSSIRWADLFDESIHLVKNDAINLEVKIDVADLDDENKSQLIFNGIDNCCDNGRVGTFRLIVNNIENLMAIRSTQFMLRSMPWFVTIFKHSSHLGLRLDARNSSDEVIYNVSVSVKIISSNERFQTNQVQAKHVRRKDGLLMERLIAWDDLIKPQNGFINKGSITLEIEIDAEKQFDVPGARKRRFSIASSPVKVPRLFCPICTDPIEHQDVSFIPCGHMFCTQCITNSIRSRKVCPTCNARVIAKQVKPLHLPMLVLTFYILIFFFSIHF